MWTCLAYKSFGFFWTDKPLVADAIYYALLEAFDSETAVQRTNYSITDPDFLNTISHYYRFNVNGDVYYTLYPKTFSRSEVSLIQLTISKTIQSCQYSKLQLLNLLLNQ